MIHWVLPMCARYEYTAAVRPEVRLSGVPEKLRLLVMARGTEDKCVGGGWSEEDKS